MSTGPGTWVAIGWNEVAVVAGGHVTVLGLLASEGMPGLLSDGTTVALVDEGYPTGDPNGRTRPPSVWLLRPG